MTCILDYSVPPRIIAFPKSQVVEAGVAVTMECRTNGDPMPRIDWFKNNRLINQLYDISFTPGYSKLIIAEVASVDDGLYQCQFSNIANSIRTLAANITVLGIELCGYFLSCFYQYLASNLYFKHFKYIINTIDFGNTAKIDSSTIKECPAEIVNNLRWPKTIGGQTAAIKCPPPVQGML